MADYDPKKLRSLREDVARQLTSCPGNWDMGDGNLERGRMREFLLNPNPTLEQAQELSTWIDFRKHCQALADRLLNLVSIEPPVGSRTIMDWDISAWTPKPDRSLIRDEAYHQMFPKWPSPKDGRGHYWPFGLFYLAAAVADHTGDIRVARVNCQIMASVSEWLFDKIERGLITALSDRKTDAESDGPTQAPTVWTAEAVREVLRQADTVISQGLPE